MWIRYAFGVLTKQKGIWKRRDGESQWHCSQCDKVVDDAVLHDRCPRCGAEIVAITTYYDYYKLEIQNPTLTKER